ncbi:MAG: tetratricopeptide repeat protein [Alphaproteobacteria bacterium]
MNPRVLKRFIILLAALTVIAVIGSDLLDGFVTREPGDYETEMGSNRLEDGLYDEALAHYGEALEQAPDHRGALMGRAIVFIQTERLDDAMAELDYLIDFLKINLEPDDTTGIGTLAAAYANRGRIHDLRGNYEKALQDYIAALNTDEETVSPGVVHKLLYSTGRMSSVRKRARYIYEQLQLPEDQRLMRIPELDAEQRMYKP